MGINVDILEKLLPNVITIMTQLAATLVLFHFMKKLAWQPVREILHKRSEYEHNRLSEAQRLKEESLMLNEKARKEIQQAGAEAKQLISIGKSEAERIRNELLEEAKRRSEETISDAQNEIALEKEQVRRDIHKEIVEVAMIAASKLVNEKLDDQKDRQAIEQFVKEVIDR